MKRIAVLGSTGSIGTQTLDIIRENPDKLKAVSLVAFSNRGKLAQQCAEFCPSYHALIAEEGVGCLTKAVLNCDVAVVATRGTAALRCVLYCLEHGIDVALANKEVLVCAGALVMPKVGKARLIPVDSEHCAVWQCLEGRDVSHLHKILLTASGGPFWNREDLQNVTATEALLHPNWSMGAKITVDSATMMNKALEVVEAHWLFGVPTEKIQIVVHRQSLVHSMVEWESGSILAQLATPDMRLPISLALLGEAPTPVSRLDFSTLRACTFEPCSFEKFPCAKLGYEIENYPALCATVMNAANDVCVESFLEGKLAFGKFYSVIRQTVDNFARQLENVPLSVENIEKWETISHQFAQKLINEVA